MWRWDQGHLPYFQFDALRAIAAFAEENDLKKADGTTLHAATGLPFPVPDDIRYNPWRQYARAIKSSLLVSVAKKIARPTPIAHILSQPGVVTCDEYFHFLARATTDPSPAFRNWRPDADFRYPLLFALKFLLARAATTAAATVDEIIGAYQSSGLYGTEDQDEFIALINSATDYEALGRKVPFDPRRQARESLLVISQISYLHVRDNEIIVSLHPEDARDIFQDLKPILGPCAHDREAEICRLAEFFKDGSTSIEFDYPLTIIDDVFESGFREGNKIKKTHITIERNAGLRNHFFATRPSPICDFCSLQTAESYPWAERILDIHHLLPLCSGTRVEEIGTTFNDLVPVCPSCHRAIHRYYDGWLARMNRKDFKNGDEGRAVYEEAKSKFPGLIIHA